MDHAPPDPIACIDQLIYLHPRALNTSHVNAVADLITEQIAITKQPWRFAALFSTLRRSNRYIVAGNLDLIATTAMYLLAPLPGRFILLISTHRTNVFHKLILNFFIKKKKARIAFVTEHARNILSSKLGPHVLEVCEVVHHSSRTADLALGMHEKRIWDDRDYDVLFFGRLNEERGLPEFLEIVESHPRIRFLVAGAGPLSDMVIDAEKRMENLRFVGHLTDTEAKFEALSRAKVLFSNMKGTENFGISILEALASGMAVSCPRDYGPVEILGSDSPYLRSPNLPTQEKSDHLLNILDGGPVPHKVMQFHSRSVRKTWLRLLGIEDKSGQALKAMPSLSHRQQSEDCDH